MFFSNTLHKASETMKKSVALRAMSIKNYAKVAMSQKISAPLCNGGSSTGHLRFMSLRGLDLPPAGL